MNNEIKTISPFRNFCITIGALPTSYLESMSYYEMLCWLCKYLENTINPAINNNAEALKELQEYVANYFDNLDVTEEINNKLDEMAEDGTLAQIINVEMIGSLSNLTTDNKTNLVSAINEVNNGLTNISTITKDTIIEGSDLVGTIYSGNYAWSNNSRWFKFFVNLTLFSTNNTNKTLMFALPQGLNVTETYTISSAGIITELQNQNYYGTCSVTVSPYGISFTYNTNVDLVLTLFPFMYYNATIEG